MSGDTVVRPLAKEHVSERRLRISGGSPSGTGTPLTISMCTTVFFQLLVPNGVVDESLISESSFCICKIISPMPCVFPLGTSQKRAVILLPLMVPTKTLAHAPLGSSPNQ